MSPMHRCPAGHLYDTDVNSRCPHCPIEGLEEASTPQGIATPPPTLPAMGKKTSPSPEPGGTKPRQAWLSPEGKTRPAWLHHDFQASGSPVVGWLVAYEGPTKGRDYRLYAEGNTIGRGPNNKVQIMDESISREAHAVLSFDPRATVAVAYMLRPGSEHMVYVFNDQTKSFEAIYQPTVLGPFSQIMIGRTQLVFVPLCGEEFVWNWGTEKGKGA